jgi:hypothetical protein
MQVLSPSKVVNPFQLPKIRFGTGQSSGQSGPPTVAPVLIVNADFGSTVASLEWTASNKAGSSGFGYKIWVGINSIPDPDVDAPLTTLVGNILSYSDASHGGASGETYNYIVRPYNDEGEGSSSNTAGVILPGESEAPILTGPSYVESGDPNATLEWNEIYSATSYRIESSPDGIGSWSTVTITVNFTEIVALVGDTYYRVIPVNGFGDGTESNVIYIYIVYPPGDTNRNLEDGSTRNLEDDSPRNLEA